MIVSLGWCGCVFVVVFLRFVSVCVGVNICLIKFEVSVAVNQQFIRCFDGLTLYLLMATCLCDMIQKNGDRDHPPSNLLARPFSDGEFYATRTSKVVGDMKLRDERAFVITRFFCVVSTRFVCVLIVMLCNIFFLHCSLGSQVWGVIFVTCMYSRRGFSTQFF